jgi:hypothetical protein
MKYLKLYEDFENESEAPQTESEAPQTETETNVDSVLKDFEELTISYLTKKGIKINSYFCDDNGEVIEINGEDTYDFIKNELPHIIENKER